MQIPNISDNEFLNVITFNDLFSAVKTSLQEQNEGNMVPGLISPGSLAFSFSGLTVSVDAPLPFRISFGDGVLAKAMGTTDGQNTTDYSIDFSSFVPSSGSSTVYLLAETVQIQQDPFTIIGPPPGHPNYDPAFAPYLAYSTLDDSLNLFASTTAPDNITTFELGRVTLSAGQTAITSINTSHQTYATSLLNPTGVASGTYTTPDLTIDPDGRILSAVENTNVALLNANNTFTGASNTFDGSVTVDGSFTNSNTPTLSGNNTFTGTSNTNTFDGSVVVGESLTVNGTGSNVALLGANNTFTGTSNTNTFQGNVDIDGSLTVDGNVTVPNATTTSEAVAAGQLQGALGVGLATGANSVTTFSATTGTFTAPCQGKALFFMFGINSTGSGYSSSMSASLSGLNVVVVFAANTGYFGYAELPMSGGQSSTFSGTINQNNSGSMSISLNTIWMPEPLGGA
jgi:cytoskeletal protein CcmA (bactofilin family)